MSTRRSKRKSSVVASSTISDLAPGANSGSTGNVLSSASSRATPSKSRAKTPRPMKELLGKRISVTWPQDKSTYPARVIDFDEKKKIHTVIYDEDNSIESVNLARRKFTHIQLEGDEVDERYIIGKKIIVQVPMRDEDNNDAPKDDYTCIVLRKSTVDDEDDEEEDNEEIDKDFGTTVDVIYLANEYITTVDLSKHQFTILDMQTGEKLKEVMEGHGSLFVDIEPASKKEKPTEDKPVQEVGKKVEVSGKTDSTQSVTDAPTATATPAAPPATPVDTPVKKSETEKAAVPAEAPAPANGEGANADDDALMNDVPPLATETPAHAQPPAKARLEVIEAENEAQKPKQEEPKNMEATVVAKVPQSATFEVTITAKSPHDTLTSVPDEGKTKPVEKHTEGENAKDVEADKPEPMDIVPASEGFEKPAEEAPEVAPIASEAEAAKPSKADETVGGATEEAPEPTKATPTPNEATVAIPKETPKPAADVVNTEVNSAQKLQPLTAENVSMLEGATVNENGAPMNDLPEEDDDVKTLSDADNEQWIASSSNKLPDPESVVKKFVGIKVSTEKERIAFVEAHLSSGNHFIEFHDKEGGSMQLVLTTENCRLLTEEEIEKLGGKRPSPVGITPGPATPTNKRKSVNGKDGNASKRRRANTEAPPPVVPATTRLPKLPPPGSEIVGKVITIEWPGNAELYRGLVIGCQFGPEKTLHKIFYVEDESMETMDLSKRSWAHGSNDEVPWNNSGLVGKRLYVYWDGEYTEDDVQKKAEEKFGTKKTKVPYEAFVVKFLGPHKYRLLYTLDDNLENRNLNDDDADWNVIDSDVMDVDGLPIISWTGPLEEE